MTGSPHSVSLRPRFYELDPYGHVNHSVYIQFFESARVSMLSEVDHGLDVLQADDVQLVVIGLSTRFLGAAGLHEDLTVETGVIETGRVKSRWAQRILRNHEDSTSEVITTQLIDFATTTSQGRPRRMPNELAEAVRPFMVEPDWLGADAPR